MKNKQVLQLTSKMIGGLLIILAACQENILFHSYQPIHRIGWYKNDTLTFLFHPDSCTYPISNVQIGIRHTDSYKYRDIWLAITPILKDSLPILQADTLHFYLADSTGNWKGKGIGEVRSFTQAVNLSSHTNDSDSIRGYRIIHLMKDQPLTDIQNVGICIQK